MNVAAPWASGRSIEQVEEGHDLAPKFDADGLIPCITTDTISGEVLMQRHAAFRRSGQGLRSPRRPAATSPTPRCC